ERRALRASGDSDSPHPPDGVGPRGARSSWERPGEDLTAPIRLTASAPEGRGPLGSGPARTRDPLAATLLRAALPIDRLGERQQPLARQGAHQRIAGAHRTLALDPVEHAELALA